MSNSIFNLALGDFNITIEMYNKLSIGELENLMDNIISLNHNNECLILSKQLLVDNKKSVSFSQHDSPEYKCIIQDEKKKNKKRRMLKYHVPTLDYIDLCMSSAHNKKQNKIKSKIKNKI